MHFDLPLDTVFSVHDVAVVLDPSPHPFEIENTEAIARHWQRASRENPALFDGEVALLSSLAWRDGNLVGRCHIVRFSSFLYWRMLRPVDRAGHVYTHAALVSSDNALVAIRMGPATANAGLVYFAAGSFEPADFVNGRADVEFNMHREVMEETGIDLDAAMRDPRYHAVSKSTGTVVFKRYFLDETADVLAARIRSHVEKEDEPEIVGPVVIRHARDLPDGLAAQMPDLIAWHFANPQER